MPTVARLIGLASEPIVSPEKGWLVDIIIQNLSLANISVGSSQTVTMADGLRLPPGATYVNDKRREALWLIADAAASETRIFYELYRVGEK